MRNLRIDMEYDGTDFSGWQRQPEERTVQGVLETAAAIILRHEVTAWGCARTDAGVHALGYVANLHTDTDIPLARLRIALNALLPDDVAVPAVSEAAPDFHARFSARVRHYQYRIATQPVALWRRFSYESHRALDETRMAAGAESLVGEHDFTSYTAAASEANPVCVLHRLDVSREGPFILIDVEGSRFLYHMVRVIAGTLMEVGKGRIQPEQTGDILRKRDRRAAGPTAAPQGLTLVSVRYE